MRLEVRREPTQGATTKGRLFIDGIFECDTLEDAIREIRGAPVTEWKVYGETAIPEGTYLVTLENSARFGPDTLTVNAVPGFDGIRIHAGNTHKDTHGCLLVGIGAAADFIGNSRATLAALKAKVSPAIKASEPVTIQYLNP